MDEADHLARAGRILTLASPPSQRLLRRWAVAALQSELEDPSTAGSRPARPLAEALAEALDGNAGDSRRESPDRLSNRSGPVSKGGQRLAGVAAVRSVLRFVASGAP